MSRTLFIIGFLFLIVSTLLSVQAQSAHPNIILILTDDQGWNGTSVKMDGINDYSKSDFYRTPHLEQLAASGMIFSNARAASPMCSPSRYAILTGQNPSRLQMTDIIKRNPEAQASLLCPNPVDEIDENLPTLPSVLKSIQGANYRCASFGKWHMGDLDPENFGFDVSDGPLGNGPGNYGETIKDDPKRIFSITESGIDFIESSVQSNQPFFLQLNHFAVHLWPQSKLQTFNNYQNYEQGQHFYKIYGAMTTDLDSSLGLLMDRLEALGIADETYVFFTSDNGSVEREEDITISPNDPLQNGKTFVWEGGLRVPFLVRGPGVLPGSVSNASVVGTDLFPTIIELAGGSTPESVDSKSFSPLLSDPDQAFNTDRPFVFHFPHFAVQKGGIPQVSFVKNKMKFLLDYETGDSFLFDLDEDIGEEVDLSDLNTKLKAEMTRELRDYLVSVQAQMPTLNSNLPGCLHAEDCDGDGLPDSWEFKNLLSAHYASTDDPDGDGYSNEEEFLGGGDPLTFNNFPLSVHLLDQSENFDIFKTSTGIRIDFLDVPEQLLLSDLAGRVLFNAVNLTKQSVEIEIPASKQSFIISGKTVKGKFQHHFFH